MAARTEGWRVALTPMQLNQGPRRTDAAYGP